MEDELPPLPHTHTHTRVGQKKPSLGEVNLSSCRGSACISVDEYLIFSVYGMLLSGLGLVNLTARYLDP